MEKKYQPKYTVNGIRTDRRGRWPHGYGTWLVQMERPHNRAERRRLVSQTVKRVRARVKDARA